MVYGPSVAMIDFFEWKKRFGVHRRDMVLIVTGGIWPDI